MNQSITCSCGAVFPSRLIAEQHIQLHRHNPEAHVVIEELPAAIELPGDDPKARQAIPLSAAFGFVEPMPTPAELNARMFDRLGRERVDALMEMVRALVVREQHAASADAARARSEAARGRIDKIDQQMDELARVIVSELGAERTK